MPYDWIPLSDDEMVAAVPPDHELAPDGPYPLARCQEETVIMPALGKDDDVLQLLKKNNLQPRIGYTTLENGAAISMVEEGLRHLYYEPPHYPETGDISRPPASRSAGIDHPSASPFFPAMPLLLRFENSLNMPWRLQHIDQ